MAKLAGLPAPVITRAREILENLENNAIAEEGQPSLAVGSAREKRGLYPRTKRPRTEAIQPSLFD